MVFGHHHHHHGMGIGEAFAVGAIGAGVGAALSGGFRHHHHRHNETVVVVNRTQPVYPAAYPASYPASYPSAPPVYPAPPPPVYPSQPIYPSSAHYWAASSGGSVPLDAALAGADKDGGPIFVGRSYYEGSLLPAKVVPSRGCAYISWHGREHRVFNYEVLVGNRVVWEWDRDGRVPPNAISVGRTRCGEELFMGRVSLHGTLTPGRIQRSHGKLYLPYDGYEHAFREYEVLCAI